MALPATTPADPAISPDALRSRADRARDAHDWPAAARAYKAFLALRPDDAGIWVQYGHACKEDGDLAEAEVAYGTAMALAPDDPDPLQQLAHLLKRLGRPEQASSMFRHLLALAPTPEVIAELQGLGHTADLRAAVASRPAAGVAGPASAGRRYIELKDLFDYLSDHTTVTGIVRVTLGLVGHVLDGMAEAEADRYAFVHRYGDGEGVLLLDPGKLRRLVRAAMQDTPDLAGMQALIADIRKTSRIAQIEAGALYLLIGAFWEAMANPSWLGGLKQRGVRLGAYLYDLIPITHSQYCDKAMAAAFGTAFAEAARLLDFALTISEFVARQVTGYVERHGVMPFPVAAVPLAHELRFAAELARRPAAPTSRLDELAGVRFVLCVCTIEARKNHAYLVNLWQRMTEEGIDMPDLVFVGREGWRVHDLLEQIEASDHLDGRLHVLHGLSDGDLQALYDRCLFTVFPSFVEGWGLPVGESLARGKVCVASSATAIPEVGGTFAVYIDPFNLQSGYEAIKRLLLDPQALAEQEARLKGFVARTWRDVAVDFFARIDTMLSGLDTAAADRPVYAPPLAPGEFLRVEAMRHLGPAYAGRPERLVFAQGWRAVDPGGTWMLDATATLRVATPCAPGQPVFVMLHVGTSSWVGPHNRMQVSASGPIQRRGTTGGAVFAAPMAPDTMLWVRLKGRVDEHGCLVVWLRVDGEVTVALPHTPVALRLDALGYAASDDVVARLDLLEDALLATQFVKRA